jgi:hypothetical protein
VKAGAGVAGSTILNPAASMRPRCGIAAVGCPARGLQRQAMIRRYSVRNIACSSWSMQCDMIP